MHNLERYILVQYQAWNRLDHSLIISLPLFITPLKGQHNTFVDSYWGEAIAAESFSFLTITPAYCIQAESGLNAMMTHCKASCGARICDTRWEGRVLLVEPESDGCVLGFGADETFSIKSWEKISLQRWTCQACRRRGLPFVIHRTFIGVIEWFHYLAIIVASSNRHVSRVANLHLINNALTAD